MPVRSTWNGPQVKAAAHTAGLSGLRSAGEYLLERSNNVVPWDEGTLADTGAVDDDGDRTVAVSYDTVYARRQHEELDWQHKPGRKAKYLEGSLQEEDATLRRIVADDLRGGLR